MLMVIVNYMRRLKGLWMKFKGDDPVDESERKELIDKIKMVQDLIQDGLDHYDRPMIHFANDMLDQLIRDIQNKK